MIGAVSDQFEVSRTTLCISFFCVICLFYLIPKPVKWYLDYRKKATELERILNLERAALEHFFENGNGPKWNSSKNWLEKKPKQAKYSYFNNSDSVRLWKGITCNESGRVTKLILARNNLKGDFTEMFAEIVKVCTELEEIDLRQNSISGCIPSSLPLNLVNLRGLYLYDNNLTGKIPLEFTQLKKLTGIYLYNNYFEGVEETRKIFEEQIIPDEYECFVYL